MRIFKVLLCQGTWTIPNANRDGKKDIGLDGTPHEALATHKHLAHPASMKPTSLEDIAQKVKSKMEEYREGFIRVEELWFEQEIAVMCGGWIEMLVRAVEECPDGMRWTVLNEDEVRGM